MRRTALRFGLWLGLCLLAAGAVFFLLRPMTSPNPSRGAHAASIVARPSAVEFHTVATAPAPVTAPGPNYSVIPGGIHSEKQLAAVLASNPVVARHYGNFDLAKMHFIRLRRGRMAYVSYRLGNLIFWTSHKIRLFSGETLVTDGTHLARARCGNLVSAVPRQPTSVFQPPNWALAAPILRLQPASFHFPKISAVHSYPTPAYDGPPGGGFPIFPVVFLPPGDGPVGSTPYPPPGSAPLPTPEPSTLLLFSTGLVILWMSRQWRLRRH